MKDTNDIHERQTVIHAYSHEIMGAFSLALYMAWVISYWNDGKYCLTHVAI